MPRRKLYTVHDTHGVRSEVFGWRPLVACRVTLRGSHSNYIVQVGPFSVSWGPAGGVEEGRASVPDALLRWGHCWWSKDGARALAIDWTRA